MNRGIYATAAGMSATQMQMDALTHNLANASTSGFKQDGLAFQDNLAVQLRMGSRAIGSMGYGPKLEKEFTDFALGTIAPTGNPLDLAIATEKGFFAVQTPQGTQYTRNGAFTLVGGVLSTHQGHPVLDDTGSPIEVGQGTIEVGARGEVTVDGVEVATLGVYDGSFSHVGNNLYEGAGTQLMDDPEIRAGALEGSNVNSISSMVTMVSLHRIFELSQRSITQQDELTQRLIQSLQDR